jgi:hypothetical protein
VESVEAAAPQFGQLRVCAAIAQEILRAQRHHASLDFFARNKNNRKV